MGRRRCCDLRGGFAESIRAGVSITEPGWTAGLCCAASRQSHSVADLRDVLNGIHVIGSIVGARADLAETFALHAAGKTRVLYETRALDQVNEAFEDVEHGRNKAPRIVFSEL